MFKKLLSMFLVVSLALSMLSINVMAQEGNSSNQTKKEIRLSKEVIKEVQEALKQDNLTKYIKQLEAQGKENAQIQISKNLILEKQILVKENATATTLNAIVPINYLTTYETTITSTYTMKSIVGINIAILTSEGVFSRNGSTVTPIDVTGTVSTSYPGWNGDTTLETMSIGSTTGYAWAKCKFHLEYYIGIDPVGMTLQTVEMACKIQCNPTGDYSATWF